MKNELARGKIVVKKSSIHGYGVFAEQSFQAGEVIEECYFLEREASSEAFYDYLFTNNKANDNPFLPLGFGSIYNHADSPNAEYCFDHDAKVMVITSLHPICAGEEIFISYGKKWFSSRDLTPKNLFSWRGFIKKWAGIFGRAGVVFAFILGMMTLMRLLIR